jgi:flagellar M-ring protein FliF
VQPSGPAGNQTNVENASDGIRTENKTFAVSHTTHHLIEPPGRIKRVAAAILVDDALETKVTDGKSVQTRRKRTPEEMKQIEDLSRAALGWDSSRGDQISVQEVAFQTTEIEAPGPVTLPERVRLVTLKWIELVRYGALLLLFLLVYLLVLKPVMKAVAAAVQAGEAHVAATRPTLSPGDREIAAQLAEPVRTDGLLSSGSNSGLELQQAMALKQQLAKTVQSDPHDAGRLVQNWIREA